LSGPARRDSYDFPEPETTLSYGAVIMGKKRGGDEDWVDFEDEDAAGYDLGDDAAMRLLLPVGQSGWAIASGYLGLLSLLCFPAPFAIVTGILALREIRRNPRKHGTGRAIFGIAMGSIVLLVFLFFVILGAIAEMQRKG
jgi:Domain of unknown function (DUF4190)